MKATVKIADVKVRPGRRAVNEKKLNELCRSMDHIGLLNPITVDWEDNLIAGRHRLEAAKILGWAEIDCNVLDLEGAEAELAEIDENVVRSELTHLELGELLRRRKELYEALNPQTKASYNGGGFKGNQHQPVVSDNLSLTTKCFAQDTADKLGVSRRTVERSVKLSEGISDEAKEYILAQKLNYTQGQLTQLSKIPKEQQYEAVWWVDQGVIRNLSDYPTAKRAAEDKSDRSFKTNFIRATAQLKNPDATPHEMTPEDFMIACRSDARIFSDALPSLNSEMFASARTKLTAEHFAELREIRDNLVRELNAFLVQLQEAANV